MKLLGYLHSDEFCFGEYDIELNVSANPNFFKARNDYYKAKSQLRKKLLIG